MKNLQDGSEIDFEVLSRTCRACPAGSATDKPGQLECDLCPPGTYADEDRRAVLRGEGHFLLSIYLSLSAVSRPIFVTQYSFFSIFRELQDVHTFAPLPLAKKMFETSFKFSQIVFVNVQYVCSKSTFFAPIWMKISRNFNMFDVLTECKMIF